MSRFHQVAAVLEQYGLDAMLVTSEPNRQYVTGFPASDGMALVTKDGSYFFTDSRYIEAAGKAISDAVLEECTRVKPAIFLAKEIIRQQGIQHLGFEEERTTVKEFQFWQKTLDCELVPASALLTKLRTVKDQEEIQTLIAAQRIAEKALEEVLDFIRRSPPSCSTVCCPQERKRCPSTPLWSAVPTAVCPTASPLSGRWERANSSLWISGVYITATAPI